MELLTRCEEIYKSIITLTGETVTSKPFEQSNLYISLSDIATGGLYRSKIEELRQIQEQGTRQIYKKKNLPFFTIGEFQNNERKNSAFIKTQFEIVDLDHLGEKYNEKWGTIIKDDRVFCAFRSPSGDGIKVIYKFNEPVTSMEHYKGLYKYYALNFGIDLGSEPDKTCDPARACYLSYDPDIYLNPDCITLSTDVEYNDEQPSMAKKNKSVSPEFLSKLRYGCKASEQRTPVLAEAVGVMIKNGFDRDFTLAFSMGWNQLNEIPHSDEKIIYTVNDLYDRYSNQSISEKTKDFYSYETGIFEARIVGNEFSIKNIGEKKFYIKMHVDDKQEEKVYLSHVVNNNDLHTLRRIDYVSEISVDKSYYTFNGKEGIFSAHIAPVPVKVKDNVFIEEYLDSLFGTRKQVIKEWLAVYCNTNYRKLPNLILTGARGTSKSTFVEMISGIFPTLSSWTKELEGNFNPDAEKKLVVIDESDSKGKIQYRTLKKYAGQSFIQVNKKYLPQYQVRNNVNLIIMSNDEEAIYVEREEAPTDERNNQFFVHKFPKFSGPIIPNFNEQLLDRIGYYIRTELKNVFDSLSFEGCRYSIPVPITNEEKLLFQNSVTEVESESDEFINKLMIQMSNSSFIWYNFVKAGYLPTDYFGSYFNKIPKHKIVGDLQRRGYLKKEKSDRYYQDGGKRPYSYKISDKWLSELLVETRVGLVSPVPKDGYDMFRPLD